MTGYSGNAPVDGLRRPGRLRLAGTFWAAAWAILAPGGWVALAQEPDWNKLEKDFRTAAAARNFPRLMELVAEAGPFDSPKAAELLIQYTLFGEDRDLELKAGAALARMAAPESRKLIFDQALRHPNFKTRIVLLGVANSLHADPAAMQVLVKALRDRSREVVYSALYWLRRIKDPKTVDALIGELARIERMPLGRLYYDLRKTLQQITGQDFEISADWKNFWEARKRGAPPPPSRGESKTRVAPRKFFSVTLDSDRLVFIIDVSTSMTTRDPPIEEKPAPDSSSPGKTVVGSPKKKAEKKQVDPKTLPIERERLHRIKEELVRTIQSLPEHVFFTVERFSHEIDFLSGSPALIQASAANKKMAVEWVRQLQANGETHTDTAFEECFKKVQGIDTIILLSDGAPRRGNVPIPPPEVLDKIENANRFSKCRIHTIGFEQAGSNLRRFLQQLAEAHDGTFHQLK